eukprot:TRINITY_DN9276_c0_g3_i1.p1 TRINITY_DN9276_c0_g3~~TRINITY_DN9276_c0_g3_i1.p1  ORF type:complete len:933 (+),score=127.84 TRINITY_DN9276_c0_g3_i1:242-3040(+)
MPRPSRPTPQPANVVIFPDNGGAEQGFGLVDRTLEQFGGKQLVVSKTHQDAPTPPWIPKCTINGETNIGHSEQEAENGVKDSEYEPSDDGPQEQPEWIQRSTVKSRPTVIPFGKALSTSDLSYASEGSAESLVYRETSQVKYERSEEGGSRGPSEAKRGVGSKNSARASACTADERRGSYVKPKETTFTIRQKLAAAAERDRGGDGVTWALSEGNGDQELLDRDSWDNKSTRTRSTRLDEFIPEGAFSDAEAMKEKVRSKLYKQKVDVSDYYHGRGIWQKIARDGNWEKITLAVIAFNAFWIYVDTDFNEADMIMDAHWVFQLAENAFCCFYVFEIIVRFLAFRNKLQCFRDNWFILDSVMAIMILAETWCLNAFALITAKSYEGGLSNQGPMLRIARLLRLSRICRMAKLLKAFPELTILLKGLFAASRSVFFTLIFLSIFLYVFSIVFTQTTEGTWLRDAYFQSVGDSAYFLLIHGTLLQSTDYKVLEMRDHPYLIVMMFMYILFSAVLVMNMLIGVLCEVVSAVASVEKEEILVKYVQEKLQEVMAIIDEDGGGTISRDEFVLILDNFDAMLSLSEIGVDVVGLVDFADFIFGDSKDADSENVELTLPEFADVILQLRGSNNATVKDIVDLRKFVQNSLETTEQLIEEMQNQVRQLALLIRNVVFEWEEECRRRPLHNKPGNSVKPATAEQVLAAPPLEKCAQGSVPVKFLHLAFVAGTWHSVEAPAFNVQLLSPVEYSKAALENVGASVGNKIGSSRLGNHSAGEKVAKKSARFSEPAEATEAEAEAPAGAQSQRTQGLTSNGVWKTPCKVGVATRPALLAAPIEESCAGRAASDQERRVPPHLKFSVGHPNAPTGTLKPSLVSLEEDGVYFDDGSGKPIPLSADPPLKPEDVRFFHDGLWLGGLDVSQANGDNGNQMRQKTPDLGVF